MSILRDLHHFAAYEYAWSCVCVLLFPRIFLTRMRRRETRVSCLVIPPLSRPPPPSFRTTWQMPETQSRPDWPYYWQGRLSWFIKPGATYKEMSCSLHDKYLNGGGICWNKEESVGPSSKLPFKRRILYVRFSERRAFWISLTIYWIWIRQIL
jgi:hypothetical protein